MVDSNSLARMLQLKGCKVPKILVLYHFNSGNTREMAQLVAEGAGQLDGADVRLKDITSAGPTIDR